MHFKHMLITCKFSKHWR